jgi:hypothetical protein
MQPHSTSNEAFREQYTQPLGSTEEVNPRYPQEFNQKANSALIQDAAFRGGCGTSFYNKEQ